jgi:hypothetical protein
VAVRLDSANSYLWCGAETLRLTSKAWAGGAGGAGGTARDERDAVGDRLARGQGSIQFAPVQEVVGLHKLTVSSVMPGPGNCRTS